MQKLQMKLQKEVQNMVIYHSITGNLRQFCRKTLAFSPVRGAWMTSQIEFFDTKRDAITQPEPKPDAGAPAIFTIGYAGRTIENLIAALQRRGVEVLWDVRTSPWSKEKAFCKGELAYALQDMGIAYQHHPELGGKQGNPSESVILGACIPDGVALMCMERNPAQCHRSFIAEVLRSRGRQVVDIL